MARIIKVQDQEFIVEVHVDPFGGILPIASKILPSGCIETGSITIPKLTADDAVWLAKELLIAANQQDPR